MPRHDSLRGCNPDTSGTNDFIDRVHTFRAVREGRNRLGPADTEHGVDTAELRRVGHSRVDVALFLRRCGYGYVSYSGDGGGDREHVKHRRETAPAAGYIKAHVAEGG